MIEIPRTKNYSKNRERYGEGGKGYEPCLCCGKWIIVGNCGVKWFHIHNGGASIVTEAEAAKMDEASDLGCYPIGPDCYRKFKKLLKPYIVHVVLINNEYRNYNH